MNIANQALFIGIASILWTVSIEPAYDAQGKEIVPSRTDCIDEGIVVQVSHPVLACFLKSDHPLQSTRTV